MSSALRRWWAPVLGAIVIVVAVGAYLALHDSGARGEPQHERGGEAGEEVVIKDPVKRRYVERTDEICKEAEAAWGRATEQVYGPHPPTVAKPEQLRALVRLVIPSLRRQIAELRAVPHPPPGDARKVNGFYDRMEVGLRALERYEKHPSAKAAEAIDSEATLRNVQALNYGMEACGQDD
jgi:hypothetical protein